MLYRSASAPDNGRSYALGLYDNKDDAYCAMKHDIDVYVRAWLPMQIEVVELQDTYVKAQTCHNELLCTWEIVCA